MRTRIAGPILPRNSAVVGKITTILPVQPSTASPYSVRIVRLLILLRTRPRLSLVNQTTSLLLFICSRPDHLLGHVLDAKLLLRRKIGRL